MFITVTVHVVVEWINGSYTNGLTMVQNFTPIGGQYY